MAEYLLVPSTRYLIPLGDLDPREAAPLSDAGLTSYHAVKRSLHLLGPGSTAVVIGAGGLGQLAIQVLKALCSATTVVAVDTSSEKLDIAKKFGADEALSSGADAVKRIKDITKRQGAELVLDLVGVGPTLTMSAEMANRPVSVTGAVPWLQTGGRAAASARRTRGLERCHRRRAQHRNSRGDPFGAEPRTVDIAGHRRVDPADPIAARAQHHQSRSCNPNRKRSGVDFHVGHHQRQEPDRDL
jgi:threonine dehydrogenase-like Zn-dependent dehydrogenase